VRICTSPGKAVEGGVSVGTTRRVGCMNAELPFESLPPCIRHCGFVKRVGGNGLCRLPIIITVDYLLACIPLLPRKEKVRLRAFGAVWGMFWLWLVYTSRHFLDRVWIVGSACRMRLRAWGVLLVLRWVPGERCAVKVVCCANPV
jgi:hypothetical protein